MNAPRNHTPNVSVDCVIFGYSNEKLNVLLIKQKPLPGVTSQQFALPGNLVYNDLSLDDSAKEILFDLTNLKGIYLSQFYAFGDTKRVSALKDQEWLRAFRKDPEARVITVAYYALVRSEDYQPSASSFADSSYWIPVEEVPNLAFDHNKILDRALIHLRKALVTDQVGLELLPIKFTLTELQNLYECILGTPLDKRNFRKSVKKKTYLKELDEKLKGAANRPAKLYSYVK